MAGLELGEPSADELQAAHSARFRVQITTVRADTVNVPADAADQPSGILDLNGNPIPRSSILAFQGQPSNTNIDSYGTWMNPENTLPNYAGEAKAGRALLLNHDYYSELPVGYSYDSLLQQDTAAPAPALPQRILTGPTDPTTRLFVDYYMYRGLELGSRPNDQIILGIITRTLRDLSVGFLAGRITCNICQMNLMSWDCPHIPLLAYDLDDGTQVICLGRVDDGHLIETSIGFKGATPEAMITKARLVAAAGRLTSAEAAGIATLELRLGRSIVDPSRLQRAWSVSLPTARKETPVMGKAVVPASRTAPVPGKRADATPPADAAASSNSDVEQLVADQAEQEAQALSDQIAAVQAQLDGVNAEISALQNQTDDQGNPVDNADAIAALQQQADGYTAELEALNAELSAVNGTVDATGGTTADAPAADAAPAQGANLARAAATLAQMRGWFGQHVEPVRQLIRTMRGADRDKVRDSAAALVSQLQQVVIEAGGQPVRTAGDGVIWGQLRRAIGAEPSVATVRTLLKDAEAGAEYRRRVIEECVSGRVSVLGAEAAGTAAYRKAIAEWGIADLEAEANGYNAGRSRRWTPGRQVGSGDDVNALQQSGIKVPPGVFGAAQQD